MSAKRRRSLHVAVLASDLQITKDKLDEDKTAKAIENGQVPQELKILIKKTFDLFDADHDGYVTTGNIRNIVGMFGMTTEEGNIDILNALDTSGDGLVEYSEFESFVFRTPELCNIILSSVPDESDKEMVEAFRELDKNGDGFIDKDELRLFMKKFGDQVDEAAIKDMIQDADENGDGKIDYNEYVKHIGF